MITYTTIYAKGASGMRKIVLSTPSVTYAMKGVRLLSLAKIAAKSVKTDSSKTGSGCTHGIMINYDDFLGAVRVLRDNDIPYSVYKGTV